MDKAEQTTDTRTNAQSARLESGTSGPWNIEQTSDGTLQIAHSDGEIKSVIARLHVEHLCDEHSNGGIAANARLIAAAPDLLEALKGLFRECAMVHKYWGEACNQAAADAAVTKACEAMAKAEIWQGSAQ